MFKSHPEGWVEEKSPLSRVIVVSRGATTYPAFTFCDNSPIFSEKLYVLTLDSPSVLAILLSDIHLVWAWAQKTSFGNNLSALSYTQAGIFETFPFPGNNFLKCNDEPLRRVGSDFFELRKQFLRDRKQGLVQFYHDFHNPAVNDDELLALRECHSELNCRVGKLYGWSDLDLMCDFTEVAYLPQGKNIRWTVSEEVRELLLNRLVRLNKQKYEANRLKNSEGKSTSAALRDESIAQDDLFVAKGGGQ
jgi:hypothetical protein